MTSKWAFQIIKPKETSRERDTSGTRGQEPVENGTEEKQVQSLGMRKPVQPAGSALRGVSGRCAWAGGPRGAVSASTSCWTGSTGLPVRSTTVTQRSFGANGILGPLGKRATVFPARGLRGHLQPHWDTACFVQGLLTRSCEC